MKDFALLLSWSKGAETWLGSTSRFFRASARAARPEICRGDS